MIRRLFLNLKKSANYTRGLTAVGCFLLVLVLTTTQAFGQQETQSFTKALHESRPDADALAKRIDEKIAARWAAEKVEPAPMADDAEYFRRIWLDIAGKIPPVSEVREFLDDTSEDKRAKAVDHLLESAAYVTNTTNTWRSLLVPESNSDFNVRFQTPIFEAWLRKQFVNTTGYDEMVRQLVTSPLTRDGAFLFYQAKESKPENLAAATSRLFLGVRLECAQCHNHPFAKWKQEDFWSFAAFYASVAREEGQNNGVASSEDPRRRDIKIPDKDKVVQAKFLDGTEPEWSANNVISPRAKLADWLTSQENPYFARAAVNRVWGNYFGTGLVDPPDDFDEELNPPSHPELLDELAAEFAAHNYSLEFVIQAITATRAYQLSSRQTDPGQADRTLFARMTVKGMSADQLFDSLAQATGYYDDSNNDPRVFRQGDIPSRMRDLFRQDNPDPLEARTSIPQALALMNGMFVENATNPAQSTTLAAVIDAPFLDTAGQIETLYLASLSRRPRPDESQKLVEYVESRGTGAASHPPLGEVFKTILTGKRNVEGTDKNVALGDVFWAILNSSEFLVNH